jgi:hypothetical protein
MERKMAERLTKAQEAALLSIDRYADSRIRFPTGEALRKAGLVTRETSYVVAREFGNRDGVWSQWEGPATPWHYWYLTEAGRAALNEARNAE